MSLEYNQTPRISTKPGMPFPFSSWASVLTLLGLMIVADQKTFKEEINEFLDSVIELRTIIDPTASLTKKIALDWFEDNKPTLEEIRGSSSHDKHIRETLAPIKSMPHKLDVITCMVRIACSDGKYCAAEKSLIKKTCLYWNVRSNFQHDLKYVFTPGNGLIEDKIACIVENYDTSSTFQTIGEPDCSKDNLQQDIQILRLLLSLQSKKLQEKSIKLNMNANYAMAQAEALCKFANKILDNKPSY